MSEEKIGTATFFSIGYENISQVIFVLRKRKFWYPKITLIVTYEREDVGYNSTEDKKFSFREMKWILHEMLKFPGVEIKPGPSTLDVSNNFLTFIINKNKVQ